jgi:hypothetical protein
MEGHLVPCLVEAMQKTWMRLSHKMIAMFEGVKILLVCTRNNMHNTSCM